MQRVPPLHGKINDGDVDHAHQGQHRPRTVRTTRLNEVNEVAKGDPARLKRLAVRFAKPVLMGDKLTTEGWEVESRDGVATYGFHVKNQNGVTVISNGIAEVRS